MKTKATFAVLLNTLLILALVSVTSADESGKRQFTREELARLYLGACSESEVTCLSGGYDPTETDYGLVVGCTYHDLQKFGAMGRQITSDGYFGTINYTWTQKNNNSASSGRNVLYQGYFTPYCGGSGASVAHNLADPDNRSGFTSMALLPDGTTLNAHHWNQQSQANSRAYRPYVFKNSTAGLADFVGFGGVDATGLLPDSAWDNYLVGDATTFIWPQIAYTDQGGAQVAHLVISSDRLDGDNTALYLRRVGSSDWETVMELGPAGYHRSFIVTNSANSERVAIAFSGGRGDGTSNGAPISRYNGQESGKNDNDLYVIISNDAGATWGALQNITQRADDSQGGFAPHAKLSAVFDANDTYHLVWQSSPWAGYGGEFITSARMYHWDDIAQTTRIAADGSWTPTDCEPGYQQLNIDNPQISSCSGKLYLTYTMFAPVPLGLGNDCHARAYSGDRVGAANGSMYITVSDNGGFNWDAPRSLVDTYTPDCDTITGTINPDCVSATWHSVVRYGIDVTLEFYIPIPDYTNRLDPSYIKETGDYLFTQYIHDHIPGAAPL
ncbi:hypothetical protein JYU03_00565, partial [bacterium AH-315-F03]|nr:hypothetical protein [bacterium AH-315-F03]